MNLPEIDGIAFDGDPRPWLIAGPCVIEHEAMALELAGAISNLPAVRNYRFVFKASYFKDNRSSGRSFRGPGLAEGVRILKRVRDEIGCPVLSDVHCREEIAPAAEVLDILQIPAFLCRQTRLIEEAARSGRILNVKKGQFLSPEDIGLVIEKIRDAGGSRVIVSERGSVFGYHDLVVDFRSFARMKKFGCPVILDVTHSLQKPAALGNRSGGEPALAGVLARAAAAVPCDGLFIETHFTPAEALSDAASMLPFAELGGLLAQASAVFAAVAGMDTNAGTRL
ncbi:MAG: 3-deoxy-8-phosphooctulonate synthase [Chitinivibrionia bacterium]|nr:3-deoxy-8-phosphooctulonate synthase [Chitinivibrionia bacterium]